MRNRFAIWLEQQWTRIGLWHLLLIPLSCLFWCLSSLRRFAFRYGILKSYHALAPVIVVGNISVGGTGKTPLVIWLAQKLTDAGYSPGIVSRGYGSQHLTPVVVSENSVPDVVGDEPVVLARRTKCPVWVCVDRVAAQQALLQAHPECNVIISDDGLQHYRMQRDIELVVVDAQRMFGNRMLIPAGPLREPVSRLKEVDAVIYNGKCDDASGFTMTLLANAIVNVADPNQAIRVESLYGKKVHAVAAIGNPQRFFQQLRNMQLSIEEHVFVDHHAFQPEDLAFAKDDVVVMTEKDAVKCALFARENWWYFPVEADVDQALAERIIQKLRK
ncbi:MAG: tetraacyldisaccharide 4'-kinase [Nitrosomonadales bacterium]|nr:tetraacyldisaccharide 4'-kinase [Nitrosomonadales bacterium]